MKYFDNEYISFFKELESNNNKEWFDQNKKRYEKSVKTPFSKFIQDLINAMNDDGAELEVEAKDCVSRINRDIRFSKDKTPYNTHFTAFISKKGRKDKTLPGFFIRVTTNNIGMMIGSFSPEKDQLTRIRQKISNNNGQFEKLIYEKDFFEKFGEIKGEIQKKMPEEFKEVAGKNFHVTLKQFYFVAEIDPSNITSDNLLGTVLGYYKIAKPINFYLQNALIND